MCEVRCFASGVGKRPLQGRLAHTRRLADYHHLANNRAAGNGWGNHSRTTPATEEPRDVIFQQPLPARVHCLEENAARAVEVNRPYLRKREKIKLSTMLITMQVTIGK